MIPTGAAIPDSTFALTYRLAELFGPTATLAMLAIMVTMGVLIVALADEMRTTAAFRRMATAGENMASDEQRALSKEAA